MTSDDQLRKRIQNQKDYCEERKTPHFAPEHGICWSCRKQIFEKVDGKSHITRCPHCSQTYCD